jgi:hypothetical protein
MFDIFDFAELFKTCPFSVSLQAIILEFVGSEQTDSD